jgi:hypothetical protein
VVYDKQESVRKIPEAHDVLTKTVHETLHKDLQLSKKSARWAPKLMDVKIKKGQVRTCKAFVVITP